MSGKGKMMYNDGRTYEGEYSDGIIGEFDLSDDDKSRANAMDFLNK